MNHESDLTRLLTEAASSVRPQADIGAVEHRSRRVRSRRRLATGVVAAMLIAGAGGAGFGLGRSAGRSSGVSTATIPSDTVPAAAVPPTTVDDVPDERDDAEARAVAEAERARAEEAATRAAEQAASGTTPADPIAIEDFIVDERYPRHELMYERNTDDGSTFRLSLSSTWEDFEYAEYPDIPGWQPATFCFGNGGLRLAFTRPGVIDVADSLWFENPFEGVDVSMHGVGWADGQPTRVAIVHTTGDATAARIVWDDGATDETDVVDEFAVLSSPGSGALENRYTVELTGPNGTERLTSDELDRNRNPDYLKACVPPPPALPPAGAQPADPSAAEAEVRANLLLLVDRSIPADEKPDNLVDDPTGIDAAVASARDRSLSTSTYSIDELVFTSPAEAWFRYSIDTSNGPLTDEYGTAHLNDGVWQIARAVICADLRLAGAECEPYVEPILPPG